MASVDTQIALAQGYVAETVAGANSAISTMKSDIANVGFTIVSFEGANLPDSPDIPDPVTAPELYPVTLEFPTEPDGAFSFQDIAGIDVNPAPQLDAEAPEITLPNLPTPAEAFQGTIPSIRTEFDFPSMPIALQNPYVEAPTLGTYTVPMAPTIALPSFDAVAPVNDAVAPTDLSASFNAAWRDINPTMVTTLEAQMDAQLLKINPQYHVQMAAIEAKLTEYLDGSTGLEPAHENQVYERARGKGAAEYRRVVDTAYATAASRGFTRPPGAVFAAVQAARQGFADNNAVAANEIAIKQVEWKRDTAQFALTTSAGLRQSMLSASLSYHGGLISINGQALEFAKTTVGMVIEVYNLSVRAVELRLEAYKADADVYDTRLKAALAARDLYESEIRALQAMVNVDQTKVALYGRRIDALDSLAKVYKSQIDAVLGEASLEKNKIDLFRLNVDAYLATVKAKDSEFQGYNSALQGEEARVRVFDSQVRAHGSEVAAYRADIDAQAEVVRAQATTNQARATQVRAALDAYATKVRARADKAGLELDLQKAQLNAYDVENRATIATAELRSTVYRNNSEIILKNTQLEVETLIKNADMNIQRARVVAELGISSAKVYEGMAGSALSGMNTLVAQTLAE